MKVLFINYLDLPCLFFYLTAFKRYEEVYYFDISFTAKTLLRNFRNKHRIKYFDFKLHELRHSSGESYLPKIHEKNLLGLCDRIADSLFEEDRFIKGLGGMFGDKRIKLFFRKLAAFDLRTAVVFMNAIEWYRQNHPQGRSLSLEFSIEKGPFYSELEKFASDELGIKVVPSITFRNRLKLWAIIAKSVYEFAGILFNGILGISRVFTGPRKGDKRTPILGIPCRHYGVTFDHVHRCDFPWLLFSGIPHSRVLIYFEDKHGRMPTTADLDNLKKASDIKYMATYNNALFAGRMPVYRSTLRAAGKIFLLSMKTAACMLRDIAALRPSVLYYFGKALNFVTRYSKAYDFYMTNGIRIKVDRDDADPYLIAEEAALTDCGGISISYQQANWPLAHVPFGSCADVIFLFGPYFRRIITEGGSHNEAVIYMGFLTDYAFGTVKGNSGRIRDKLRANGARFIICYFDENSFDDRMSGITNRQSENVYRKFMELLISDGEIGFVFSPKDPSTLYERISGASGIIEKAKATGRCVFLEGEIRTDSWPTEAAQASDLAVGSLEGGTTVLESLLSGVRAVYLDLLGYYSNPEYTRGKGSIVFSDVDGLIAAIKQYRSDPAGFGKLGDASLIGDILSLKDPFRDGKAAERMGTYIRWLLEELDSGKAAKEAIGSTSRRYAEKWGKENIATRLPWA